MIPYKLIRSQRKTLSLRITAEAEVEVRAPLRMPLEKIEDFITEKENWLQKHLTHLTKAKENRHQFQVTYGMSLQLLGKPYKLSPRPGKEIGFDGQTFYAPPGLSSEELRNHFIRIYKTLAQEYLFSRASYFTQLMKVKPTGISLSSAKTSWGSCSGQNRIRFSWRLIMAEKSIIDYVVVHELAHILEHNHSPRFWAIVAAILPDYPQHRQGLRALQKRLEGENWE